MPYSKLMHALLNFAERPRSRNIGPSKLFKKEEHGQTKSTLIRKDVPSIGHLDVSASKFAFTERRIVSWTRG